MNLPDASIDICAGLLNSHAKMLSCVETCIPDVIKSDRMQTNGYPLHHNHEMCNKHFDIQELVQAVQSFMQKVYATGKNQDCQVL